MNSMGISAALPRSRQSRSRGRVIRRKSSGTFWFTGSRGWSLLAFLIVGLTFLTAPAEDRYPGALAGALTFYLVQCFFPTCQPVSGKVLCPWNWALFVFFLQLVLLPLSLLLSGPSLGVLPFLPSDRAINLAMLVNSAAFLACCTTYHYFARATGIGRRSSKSRQPIAAREPLSLAYIAVNGAIGIMGFFLAFGALDRVKEYFSDPFGYLSRLSDASDRLGLAAGLFLRPFLGICVIMLWCRWLDQSRSARARIFTSVVTGVAIVAVCLSNSTFNYNRGSVVVPLVAMLTVTVNRPGRVPRRTVLFAGAMVFIVLLAAPFYGAYRSSKFTGQEILSDASVRNVLADRLELTEMLQVYGGAPQFLGFFLEMDKWGANPQWGKVLTSSALAPLPILGKPFREATGTAIYNRLIYGQLDARDQIAPFQGETFIDFHLPGLLVGFAFLGWIAFKLQSAFARSSSFFEIFTWQYVSVWTFFLIFGSLSVVSQIFIYFCWPFYLYFIFRNLRLHSGWK